MKKSRAMELWIKHFGNVESTKDFTGRKILKSAYNDNNSNQGWNLDHAIPFKVNKCNEDYNLLPVNIKTNEEKADDCPEFTAKGKHYKIITFKKWKQLGGTAPKTKGYIYALVNNNEYTEADRTIA